MSIIERFNKDPRIIIARTIDDFSLIGKDGIKGAILRNPNKLKPEDIVEIEINMTYYRQGIKESQLDSLPEYLGKTGRMMMDAFKLASRPYTGTPWFAPRVNNNFPTQPHSHELAIIADVTGPTTIGYTDDDLSKPYDFPSASIIGIEDILHRGGEANVWAQSVERMNLVLG